jgi:hypothetical protein
MAFVGNSDLQRHGNAQQGNTRIFRFRVEKSLEQLQKLFWPDSSI